MDDFIWETEEAHPNNTYTMCDYIENHMPNDCEIVYVDGSYAEIIDSKGQKYAVHAGGNGDFNNHIVRFDIIK